MQNQELYDKYLHSRHWDAHNSRPAGTFAIFLSQQGFTDLVVDLGCGSGRDVDKLASFGLNVLGVDNSPQEVRAASLRYEGLRFLVYDAENLLFADASVGAFYTVNVLHYVDQERVLHEIMRTLRPGGWLFAHFNLLIEDIDQNQVDYQQEESEIIQRVQGFRIEQRSIFFREDSEPFLHRHTILQLILQKPS